MDTTPLPTKHDYESAVEELRQLNEDIFYADFKARIKKLEDHFSDITSTKEQLAGTEKSLAVHMNALQEMNHRLEQLQQSYEEMFKMHANSIKNILVVRDEALINKIIHQIDYRAAIQLQQDEKIQRDIQLLYEQLESFMLTESKKSHELLRSIEKSYKEDLAAMEKKQTFRTYLLLSIVVIEAIVVGIKLFI